MQRTNRSSLLTTPSRTARRIPRPTAASSYHRGCAAVSIARKPARSASYTRCSVRSPFPAVPYMSLGIQTGEVSGSSSSPPLLLFWMSAVFTDGGRSGSLRGLRSCGMYASGSPFCWFSGFIWFRGCCSCCCCCRFCIFLGEVK